MEKENLQDLQEKNTIRYVKYLISLIPRKRNEARMEMLRLV